MTRWLGRLLPGTAVLAAAVAIHRFAEVALLGEIVRSYPWAVYGVALTLAVVFHRSRVALSVILLAAVDVAIAPETEALAGVFAGSAVALLVGGLALGRDRGLLSRGGAVQATVVLALGLLTGYAWRNAQDAVALVFSWAPAEEGFALTLWTQLGELTTWTGLDLPTVIAFALAGSATLWGLIRWGGAVEWGLAWGLLALALAIGAGDPSWATLYLMAGALALATSVVQITYSMAYIDDLTGLPGRRALMRDLDALSGAYTLAMVDVDHFKGFNDRHGHDVGDQVLKMVAGRLGRAPGGGKAYRYGGEEFTLLFSGRRHEDALPHIEAVRRSVEDATFTLRSRSRPRHKPKEPVKRKETTRRTLSVTVSVGVADSTINDPTTKRVLKRADQALYRAKKGGRNRVSR